MRLATVATAIAASCSGALAQQQQQQKPLQGFNSGATDDKGAIKTQADFEKEFRVAQDLEGAPGTFTSMRLYTNIQGGTPDTPIAAFPAAIKTQTKLLLGIWCSGTDSIASELAALSQALDQHGRALTDLVVGLSVGSEDLYRVSEPGVQNEAGIGAEADILLRFINETREALRDTPLRDVPVGHVDTWTAWVNGSNSAVIDAVDFLGMNLFPYYEKEKSNDIGNGAALFADALDATERAAGADKPVWITETGWPASGPDSGDAQASLRNARTYWEEVGCGALFGERNVWWYVLRDSNPENEAKFAVTEGLDTSPRFDLSCPAGSEEEEEEEEEEGNGVGGSGGNRNGTETDGGGGGGGGAGAGSNSTETGGSGSGSGGSNSTQNNSTGGGGGGNGGDSQQSQNGGDEEGSAGGSGDGESAAAGLASVSLMNAGATVLSMGFALAAWLV